MSTVIRKAIIEIETRSKKGRLEAPQIDAASKAYKEVEKAAQDVSKADAEIRKSQAETAKVTQEFGLSAVRSYREGGEGALRMMRGVALLSASGSEDMRKLMQTIALAQGAFDTAFGAAKLARVAASFGPIGAAVAGVTAVLGLGAIAWRKWTADVEAATKAALEARDALRKYETEQTRIANRAGSAAQRARADLGDLGIRFAGPAEREQRIATEIAREARERGAFAAEQQRIERAGLKPRGTQFGETRPEMQEMLDRYGGFQGMRERRASLLEKQEASVRRQLELTDETRRIQEDAAKAQRALAQQAVSLSIAGAAVGGAGAAGIGPVLGASLAGGQFLAGIDQQMQQFNERFRETFRELLGTLDEVQQQIRKIKQDAQYPS